jgi:DNA-binding MarR family transcriptional regulator
MPLLNNGEPTVLSTEAPKTELRRLLVRASRDLLRALENGVRTEGLGLVDHEVLRCAVGTPGSVQRDLAAALGVDLSVIAVVLDKLEEAGCTKRQDDEGDRRRRAVEVTAVGHRTLRRCAVIATRVEEEFFGGLDDDEQRLLDRLLARLPLSRSDPRTTQTMKPKRRFAAWSVPHPPGSRRWS